MNQSNAKIPDEMADDVLEVASRLYSQANNSYSLEELQQAGSEVSIPPEYIEKAIEEVKRQQHRKEIEAQEKAERQQTFKWIGIGAAALIGLWGILSYNSLSSARQDVKSSWAQVENQMQRRADLIPNLVATAKAQARQEQTLVQSLSQSRDSYLNADSPEEKIQASAAMDQAIQQFNQYAISNPALSQAYTGLQDEIAGSENRIATERMRYNEAVENYNRKLNSFPSSFFGSLAGFKEQPFFQADNTANPDLNDLL
ncbi:MAG: LemA family protein [Microcoleaceae cyanobacterium]